MKKVIALSLLTASLFAGKNVIPATAEPVAINPAPAVPENLASKSISLKVGTLGFGTDFEYMFNKNHALRLNLNYFKYTRNNEEIKGITYDAKLTLQSAGLIYDYHPWESSFRLSTGIYYNGNKLTATAKPTNAINGEVYEIGDRKYKFVGNAEIDAKVDFKKVAPYIGIGWSSTENNGWHFTADIGVMYVGSPKVNYKINENSGTIYDVTDGEPGTAVADVNNDPQVKSAIDKEAKEIYDKMKKYKWYPVITIGIQKKF